jgi:hypothetical protein
MRSRKRDCPRLSAEFYCESYGRLEALAFRLSAHHAGKVFVHFGAGARCCIPLLILMLQGGFFNNRLYFFQAFLSYLYLLSFVLHEAFLWDSSTIEPVRIFLQVIGIPAWSLPEVYAPATPPTR